MRKVSKRKKIFSIAFSSGKGICLLSGRMCNEGGREII